MESPKNLEIRITKDEGYRVVPVNGGWGGVTPQGDIFIDVYHEAQVLPEEITQQVSPDGELGDVLERSPEFGLQRNVWVGMVLTVDKADSMGRWLQEMADQARNMTMEEGEGIEEGTDVATTH